MSKQEKILSKGEERMLSYDEEVTAAIKEIQEEEDRMFQEGVEDQINTHGYISLAR